MTPFNFSNKKDQRNITITREMYRSMKLMDISLKRVIERMNSTTESLNTFSYVFGEALQKIRDADPTIDDADLT